MVRSRRALLLCTVVAAGCGPRAGRGAGSAPPPPPTIAVAPLTVHTLTATERGLVLGVGGTGRAAPVALAASGSTVQIARVTITVRPATPGAVATTPAGPLWGWRFAAAERAATALLALRPGDRVVSARAANTAPPTSGTLAVAILAALTGVEIDARCEVLAEVRADGTLSPLADPVGEVDRAIRRGATRLVLPLGGGTATPRSGAPIDLVKRAARGRAAASLSPDLAGAYRALTGGALPDADQVAPEDLALTAAERAALAAAYGRHLARLADAWPRVVEQENRAGQPASIGALLDRASSAARSAERLRVAGASAGAYASIARAAAAADAGVRIDGAVSLTQGGELAAARVALDAARAAAAAAVTAATASVSTAPPASSAGDLVQVAAMAAELAAARAWADEAVATSLVAAAALAALGTAARADLTSRETRRIVADAIAPTLIAAARARQHAESAADRVALDGASEGGDGPLEVDAAHVEDLVRRHRQAVASGQVLAEQAAPGAARSPGLVVGARALAGAAADDDRPPVALLGAAARARQEIAAALAPGDGLAGAVDSITGEPVKVARPEVVKSALRIAERAARQHASAVRVAVGFVPAGARVAFLAASDLAAGDRADQLAALALYRAASGECRLAIDLALTAVRPSPTAPRPNPNPNPNPNLSPSPSPSPTPSPTSTSPPPPAPAPAPSP